MMMTVVGSFYTVTACYAEALKEIGASSWKAVNSSQEKFLQIFDVCKSDVGQVKEIEFEVGIGTVNPVNSFLKRKNMNIQLSSISPTLSNG